MELSLVAHWSWIAGNQELGERVKCIVVHTSLRRDSVGHCYATFEGGVLS